MPTIVSSFGPTADADLPYIDCNLSDDLLWGGEPIAWFVSDLIGEEVSAKRIYQWVDKDLLPVGHFGGRLVGSKRTIAAHFAAIASEPSPVSPRRPKPAERHSHRPQSVPRRRRGLRAANQKPEQNGRSVTDPVPLKPDTSLTVRAGDAVVNSAEENPLKLGNAVTPQPDRRVALSDIIESAQ